MDANREQIYKYLIVPLFILFSFFTSLLSLSFSFCFGVFRLFLLRSVPPALRLLSLCWHNNLLMVIQRLVDDERIWLRQGVHNGRICRCCIYNKAWRRTIILSADLNTG